MIAIFNFNFNKDFQNVVNKIYLLTGNEEEEQEKYTIQEVKMLAVSLKVKESYNEDIMVKPLTCSVNINRMVKLIYMDGDKELGSKYIYYRKPVGNLMQPSKKGFDFVEWTNVEGEVVDKDTVLASEVDYYVYANWNKHVSTLTVNPASGVWNSSTETKNFNLAYEETKEITDPTRDGYNFTGWDLKGEASTLENKIFTMGYENSTLTAQWTPKEYNLNFNANQGGNLSMNSKKVTYTMPYGELATTSRTSYTFGGWYTAAQGGTQVNEQTIHSVTHDTTVYAHWNNTAPATPQITTYYKNANKSEQVVVLKQ